MSKSVQFTQTWHKHDGGPCPVKTHRVWVMDKHGAFVLIRTSLVIWERVHAYTTDIFDGNFDHISDVGEKVLTGKAGDTFTVNTAGEWEKVEPTRGAGCENTPEWLYETINQQRSAK